MAACTGSGYLTPGREWDRVGMRPDEATVLTFAHALYTVAAIRGKFRMLSRSPLLFVLRTHISYMGVGTQLSISPGIINQRGTCNTNTLKLCHTR